MSVVTSPRLLFIVPYRDREQQLLFFDRHMTDVVLKDTPVTDYRIVYVHQNDTRSFNRGGLKNIGFLWARQTYPEAYRDMTLIFNDVDNMPFTAGFLDYATTRGKVKHFYGFKHTLGGIVAITGADFERCGGFPNFWAWGYEDNAFQHRVLAAGIAIDRSQFYPIFDKNILLFVDGMSRSVNRREFDRYLGKTGEGFRGIRNLRMDPVEEETGFINVNYFDTDFPEDKAATKEHDLRKGAHPFKGPAARGGGKWSMSFVRNGK